MKYKMIAYSLFMLCLSKQGNGQPGSPVAVATTKGIWIYLGNLIPKEGYYLVERKRSGENSYKEIGRATVSLSVQEMERRQQQAIYFDKLDALNRSELERIWRYLQQRTTNDSLVSRNLPVMHLMTGTAFFDNDPANDNYQYRITFTRNNGTKEKSFETRPVAWPGNTSLPVARFVEMKYGNGQLMLQWFIDDKKDLAYYNVYRSIFGKNEFQKIALQRGFVNRRDSLLLIAVDSIGTSPSLYEYKVEPLDIYGNAGEMGGICAGGSIQEHYIPPVLQLSAVSLPSDHAIRLKWKQETKKYISSISVMRSNNYDSGYTRIFNLPANDTLFTDHVPVAGENYYYYLVFNGPGNVLQSSKVAVLYNGRDQRPTPPAITNAEAIENGAQLSWEYNEPFIKGFYVYRNGNSNESFRQVSQLITVRQDIYSYTDTSSLLRGNNIYQYYIRAITDNDILSDPSDTVSVHPGKKAYVAVPMHLSYTIEDNKVVISWENMSSIQNDLLGYRIYKKSGTDITTNLITTNYFIDSGYQNTTEYAVTAIDQFGNESVMSQPVLVNPVLEVSASPVGVKAEPDGDGILIRWAQTSSNGSHGFVVYRSENGKSRRKISTVNADESEFLDKDVSKGKLYFYEVTMINASHKESEFSEKVAIRYK